MQTKKLFLSLCEFPKLLGIIKNLLIVAHLAGLLILWIYGWGQVISKLS